MCLQIYLAPRHLWQFWRWPSSNIAAHLFPSSDTWPNWQLCSSRLQPRYVWGQLKADGTQSRNSRVSPHGAILSASREDQTRNKSCHHWILNSCHLEKNWWWRHFRLLLSTFHKKNKNKPPAILTTNTLLSQQETVSSEVKPWKLKWTSYLTALSTQQPVWQ